MDNQEAKFILNAYRPDGQDADDPRFAEALAQARRDPLLERWFRESVAFDAAMTEKLCAVVPPPGLRESILAGAKVSRPLRWSRPALKWALAAALLVAAIIGSLILRDATRPQLADWQTEALQTVSSLVNGRSKFDAESHSAANLIAWLKTNRAPAAERLPENLEKLQSLGCKTFSWNGLPVSVICFTRHDGGLIHLVTTHASAAAGRTLRAERKLVQQGPWTTATWREGDMIYMLALEGSRDQLRAYLL
jgi:hypothetical protein